MALGIRIFCFHGRRHREEDILGSFELIGELFQPDQRPHPRQQLGLVKGLAEKVIGASFNPSNPVVHSSERGEQNDRD